MFSNLNHNRQLFLRMGCGSSKDDAGPPPPSQKFVQGQPQLSSGTFTQFPPTFKLYYTGRKKLKKTDFLALVSEEGGKQVPVSVVTFHMGNLDRKRQVTLYTGTTKDTPPMATAGIDRLLGKEAYLSLPGAQPSGGNRTETMFWPKGYTKQSFEIPVGLSGDMERFEWRSENMLFASGGEIRPWHLIRVGRSDEVVATWTEWSAKSAQGEIGKFEFQGSALTGELGPYWALVAVTSWLWLLMQRYTWNKFLDQMVDGGGGLLFFGLGMI